MMDDDIRQHIAERLALWEKVISGDVDAAIEAGKLFLGQTDEGGDYEKHNKT